MKPETIYGWGRGIIILLAIILPLAISAPSDITTMGEVGIGTTNPQETLHVNGSIKTVPKGMELLGAVSSVESGTQGWLDQARDVTVVGNLAYAVSGANDSISIIDITNPTAPRIIGGLTDVNYLNGAMDVEVVGKYAYVVSNFNDSLSIIDVSDPITPVIVGNVMDSGTGFYGWINGAYDVAVAGGYAYVVSSTNDSITAIDISDSTNPSIVSGLTADELNGATGISISGGFAYVASNSNSSLTIIDISDPRKLSISGTISEDGLGSSGRLSQAKDVIVKGNYAYVVSTNNDSLTIIDIRNPAAPSIISSVSDRTMDGPYHLSLGGDYAYITAYTNDSLTVVDISDPTTPFIIESFMDSGTSSSGWLNGAYGISISGEKAIVVNYVNDSLSIIDLQGFKTHAASIDSVAAGRVHTKGDVDVSHRLQADSVSVGSGDVMIQGNLGIKGIAQVKPPTMYLTSETPFGTHNCDDNPEGCCEPNYHMCTVPEILTGGRTIEDSGTGRDTTPYNTEGDVDPGDDTTTNDCDDWTSASSGRYGCSYTTTVSCSVKPIACSGGIAVWCCSN